MIRLTIAVNPGGASPRELRSRFALALREAIARGCLAGRIDQAAAEELFRAIPDPERA